MRLTVGMLRQVIREEVEKVRRGRLYESMEDPERAELKAVAALKKHKVLDNDKIMKMSLDDCEAYGFPPGTLYCNVSGEAEPRASRRDRVEYQPYLKFPGGVWSHESNAQA